MGDEGRSCKWEESSSDDVELEYRIWRAEKVGVSGEAMSDDDEFVVADE
jgi:hypothetical protein